MRSRYARFLSTMIVILTLAFAAACGGGGGGDGGTPQGDGSTGGSDGAGGGSSQPTELVVGIPVDITTLDPNAANARNEEIVFQNMFDGLLTRDENMNLVPHLATSWEWAEDGTSITFELRDDVTFHNGEPFNAEAVKFSVERIMDENFQSQYGPRLRSTVASVDVIDDYTVRFNLLDPYAPFLAYLSSTSNTLAMVPPQYFAEVGEEGFREKPVGTGAYKFVEYVPDERLVLEANEDYFLGRPAFDRIVFRPIPDAAARVAAVISGDVDIIGPISPEQVQTVEQADGVRTESVATSRRVYVGFNTTLPPMDNKLVRQALNYAVDVDAIIENVLQGHGQRMNAPVISFELGGSEDVPFYPYDPEKARQLLEQAGYGDGLELTFDTPNGRYLKDLEAAQAIAGYLEDVGITVNLRVNEWAVHSERSTQRTFGEIYLLGWGGGGTFDADLTLFPLLTEEGGRGYYVNPETEALIYQARQSLDNEERKRIYEELMQIFHDEVPWLYLWSEHSVFAISDDVDWTPMPDETLWMFRAKPR